MRGDIENPAGFQADATRTERPDHGVPVTHTTRNAHADNPAARRPKRLYLFGTGTGLAPFMSIIRDPDAYERYEHIVLVHGCRLVAELAYRDYITYELPQHEILGEMVRDKLKYYPTVTREPFQTQGRIPDLIESGQMARDLGLPELNPAEDRVMLCGSPEMLKSLKSVLEKRGFKEGNTTQPGDYVVERAFVEQ